MDLLLEKLNEYKSITGYRMEYVLEDESIIDFKLRLAIFYLSRRNQKNTIIYSLLKITMVRNMQNPL